ncbi:MAG: hypothetical protein IPK79_10585 [Vampirovibrionales bacterium]|nr:hypothetical protein [Vampirovibrionales bacterium]
MATIVERPSASAQALSEYSLALALVTLAGVAGLAFFAPTLFSGLGFMGKSVVGKGGVVTTSVGGTAISTPTAFGPKPPPGMTTEKICFKNGSCLQLPVISQGARVTDTAGGLGGDLTQYFSEILAKMAEQMKAEGVDPATIALITDLAKSGHDLGSLIDIYAKDPAKEENQAASGSTSPANVVQYDLYRIGSSTGQLIKVETCSNNTDCINSVVARLQGANPGQQITYNGLDPSTAPPPEPAITKVVSPPSSEVSLKSALAEFQTKFDALTTFLDKNPDLLKDYPQAQQVIELESKQIDAIASGIPTVCTAATCSVASSQTYPLQSETTDYAHPETGAPMMSTTLYKADLGGGNSQLAYKTESYPDGTSKLYQFDALSGNWTGPIPSQGVNLSSATINNYVKNDSTSALPPKVNNATLVHQDSNVICASGGDTNQCVIDVAKP